MSVKEKTSLAFAANLLFAQLEVLSNENLKGEKLQQEIEKTIAMSKAAETVNKIANTMLDVKKMVTDPDNVPINSPMPSLLNIDKQQD